MAATTHNNHFIYQLDDRWKLSKKDAAPAAISKTTRTSTSAAAAATHRRCAFTRKCAHLVKEQRARFYIMRRCVTMLICWRDYGES